MPAATVLGTGLIGASIGLALRERGWSVIGWDPDPSAMALALERGCVDAEAGSEADACTRPADVLVFAGPPAATVEFVSGSDVPWLAIDVAGTKSSIVAASQLPRFVGTHPMTGREMSGPAAATASLFAGATWVIATDGAAERDLGAAEVFVERLGARPVRMTAAEHDAAVAVISHVPQLVAAALVRLAGDRPEAMELAAGSFRDLTRVAASDPSSWIDVLASNRIEVAAALDELRRNLDELSGAVTSQAEPELETLLAEAGEVRRSLTARATAVRVALADRPGELARVGEALSMARADVRDIQLRHAPYGGGGVLTISVRPGDAAALTDAIRSVGLVLAD